MKRIKIFSYCFLIAICVVFNIQAVAQPSTDKAADPEELSNLRKEIEKNPADLDLHAKYLKASGFTRKEEGEIAAFIKQYEDWIIKFPTTAAIPYALGHAFAGKESPKAKPYLLKAVAIDPKFDKAYFDLWIDGERWGDFKVSREYLNKAKEAAPDNADYAFYYANGFDDTDFELYRKLSLQVAKDFPTSERGAQALYWLAHKEKNVATKILYYEQLKSSFPVDKFNWSMSGMSTYFEVLLEKSAKEAVGLAAYVAGLPLQERGLKTWNDNTQLAKNVAEVQSLLKNGKAVDAIAIADKIQVPRYGSSIPFIILLKAQVLDEAGKTKEAYEKLLTFFAKEPTEKINNQLLIYGNKINKASAAVNKDVLYVRDTTARQAPVFNLETYLTKGKSSLNDYKGKVVLLTYWFPGCGPCRGEFPHFENVVKNFKGKDFVYLGINILGDQDDYVVPFMKSSGYSFIPLKDNKDWQKGPLDNRGAAPVNFLIDQDGRIIFSNFRTDGSNEATLEMMIQSLLVKK